MSNVTGASYPGPFDFSLQDVKDHLVDLPKNATQRLRKLHDGIEDVVVELAQNFPAHGESAGISGRIYQDFLDDTQLITKLSAHEAILEKALEVVRETKAKMVHERENTIAQMVDSIKSTAHRTGDDSILAPFEQTLRYNSQIAEKAAQTRRRNAEAESADEGNAPQNPTP